MNVYGSLYRCSRTEIISSVFHGDVYICGTRAFDGHLSLCIHGENLFIGAFIFQSSISHYSHTSQWKAVISIGFFSGPCFLVDWNQTLYRTDRSGLSWIYDTVILQIHCTLACLNLCLWGINGYRLIGSGIGICKASFQIADVIAMPRALTRSFYLHRRL